MAVDWNSRRQRQLELAEHLDGVEINDPDTDSLIFGAVAFTTDATVAGLDLEHTDLPAAIAVAADVAVTITDSVIGVRTTKPLAILDRRASLTFEHCEIHWEQQTGGPIQGHPTGTVTFTDCHVREWGADGTTWVRDLTQAELDAL